MNINTYREILRDSYKAWLQTPGGRYAHSVGMRINNRRFCHDLLCWIEWLDTNNTLIQHDCVLQTVLHLQKQYNAGGSVVWYNGDKPGAVDNLYHFRCRCPGLFDFEGDTAYISALSVDATPSFRILCFDRTRDHIPELKSMAEAVYDTLDEAASALLAILITHGALSEGE